MSFDHNARARSHRGDAPPVCLGLSDVRAGDNTEQKAAVAAAIRALPLKAGADITSAVEWIEFRVGLASVFRGYAPALPSTIAVLVGDLATAMRNLRAAVASLEDCAGAWNALCDELESRDFPVAFLVELVQRVENDQYFRIERAADTVAIKQAKEKRRGRQREYDLVELATSLADTYFTLTGKEPPISRSENTFSRFLGEVFAAFELKGEALYWAAVGAKERLKRQHARTRIR